MNITYWLMLLFVFWTLYRLSMAAKKYMFDEVDYVHAAWSVLYALLGTFFFHSIW